MKIAILMLTYNAPRYVYKSVMSLGKTANKQDYELIVVDNASKWPTRCILWLLHAAKKIDTLYYNEYNSLFARGNNIASSFAKEDITHYLLLNSDVEIKDPEWMRKLINLHKTSGISSLGCVKSEPIRADGYCMLIDRWLYDKYMLDEDFEWWWSVTKLESEVLKEGLPVRAVVNHENLLHHFGGASGKGWKDAKGMDISIKEVMEWFEDKSASVEIIDSIE